ncbi:MAG: hypothetical protein HYU86_12925 [Chloroflexi bacterium]|nr:hypothetical protein [Chloroflexota bacterium]
MKRSEEISRDCYREYLEKQYSNVDCARGDDPPDFVFTCDGEKHAVEVTELHEYLDVYGEEESRKAFDESIRMICERSEKEFSPKLKTLNRSINVVISTPTTEGELRSLRGCILSYVDSGAMETEQLFGRDDCQLTSFPDDDPVIVPMTIPSAASNIPGTETISADIQARTDYALNRILCAKLPRMEKLSHFSEKVLIVYSMDPLISLRHVTRAVEEYVRRGGTKRILTKMFFIRPFAGLGEPRSLRLEEIVPAICFYSRGSTISG